MRTTNTNSGLFLYQQNNIITVQSDGNGDFETVVSALASITDSSSTNRYAIKLASEIFVEQPIDLRLKPYVSIIGESLNTSILVNADDNLDFITLGLGCEISFLTIRGSGNVAGGVSAIYCNDWGNFSQMHKVSIYDFSICVKASTVNIDSYLYLEYVDFGGVFDKGIVQESTGVGVNFVNAENQYAFPTSTATIYTINGASAQLELLSGGCEPSAVGGIGIQIENGCLVNCYSYYFNKFNTAILMPNVGTTPTAFFIGSKTQDCVTDINISHITGQGMFSGGINNPVINIVASSPFAISYFENIVGNKQELYYDNSSIIPVAVTVPTASACTQVVFSSVSGLVTLSFSGTTNQNGTMNFRVPKDYLRNGRFKIIWSTSSTSANKFVFAPIISVKPIGSNLTTQTETLTPQIITAGTISIMQETAYFTPTTPFLIGELVVVRVTREATNVSDTFTGAIYVSGVVFEYESSK